MNKQGNCILEYKRGKKHMECFPFDGGSYLHGSNESVFNKYFRQNATISDDSRDTCCGNLEIGNEIECVRILQCKSSPLDKKVGMNIQCSNEICYQAQGSQT